MRTEKALERGDAKCGIMMAGQVCSSMDDIPTAWEVIERIITEANSTLGLLKEKVL